MFAEEPEKSGEWVRLGVRYIGADVDSQILLRASRERLAAYRAAVRESAASTAASGSAVGAD